MNKLNILYEDNHIIVVVKEANILSQKDITGNIDIMTLIKEYLKEKYNKPGNVYLGLVHRLDRMVSGVMVFAKTSKASSRLSEQIRNKNFEKKYICVVKGVFDRKCDILKDYLIKDEKKNKSFVTTKEKGKEAILKYKTLNTYNNLSLLEITLITGRHHQIRVQLSSRNHPIYGDNKYDINPIKCNIMLHAYQIKFTHPTTKEELTFTNYPKNDLWNKFLNN